MAAPVSFPPCLGLPEPGAEHVVADPLARTVNAVGIAEGDWM